VDQCAPPSVVVSTIIRPSTESLNANPVRASRKAIASKNARGSSFLN
jgi:hypothetical protein